MRRSAVLLFLVFAAAAQTLPDRFIVELNGEPAVRTLPGGGGGRVSEAAFRVRLEAIGREQQAIRAALEQAGAEVTGGTMVGTNTLFVRIPEAQGEGLRSIPGVWRVHAERFHRLLLDHALPLLHVPEAWNQIGGMGNAGKGIKVAVIDTGIDSSHPAFKDLNVSAPAGFPKVSEPADLQFTNNKIIVARSYTSQPQSVHDANDLIGHGTGVAMVAAGVTTTGQFGTITGVAPRAFLGNYKVFPDGGTGAPDSLILQAIDDAIADGMDVINLSLGSNPAPRPQDDILVSAIENAVKAGLIVAIAAGNDGPNPNTIASPAIAPSAISVGNMFNDRVFSGAISVNQVYRAPAISGDGPNSPLPITAALLDIAHFDPTGLACGPLPPGRLTGAIPLILRGTCTFETKINNAKQAGAVAALIYTDAARPSAITMVTGSATLPASMVDNGVGAVLKQQLATGPGISYSPPGRLPARPPRIERMTVTLDFSLLPRFVSPNRLGDSSSGGPNSDGGIKPEIVSVGSNVSTAEPLSQGGFVVESGTSFSSPALAGAAALLKAARPGLTALQYRSLLIDSATPLVFDSELTAGVQKAGGGKLNVWSALNATVTAIPAAVSFGANGSTVDQTRTITITNIGASSDIFSLLVFPANGSVAPVLSLGSVQLDTGQSKDITLHFTSNGLASGSYQGTIRIQGSRSSAPIAVPYWCGVGPGTAQYLSVLYSAPTGVASSQQTIYFRITDREGIPLVADPLVSVSTGRGSVVSVQSVDFAYPGVYGAGVRLSATAGVNVFHISAGGLSADVTIQGQ